ncbi:MAG: choice-of-anchor Q domain-containing protein [Tahibacter sp.]
MSFVIRTLFVLFAFMGAAQVAHADAEFCVDSVSDFAAAIAESDNQDVVAKIVVGQYTLSSMPHPPGTDDVSDALTLIGGYAPGCGSRTSVDPKDTRIQFGIGVNDLFSLKAADLHLESLSLIGMNAGISLYAYTASLADATVTLRRVEVRSACVASPHCSSNLNTAVDIYGADVVNLSQVLITGNGSSGCAVRVRAYSLDDMSVTQSTFANNAGKGLCIDDTSGSNDGFYVDIYNNIFWNNGSTDLRTDGTERVRVVRNIAHTTSFTPAPESAPVNLLDENPQFSGSGSSAFLPVSTSPAVNFGTLIPPGGLPGSDIAGNPRLVGNAPDLGAYETDVDDLNNLLVTNTSDALIAGSLRFAVTQANNSSVADVIRFNIPGSCPRTINLASPLPNIEGAVTIDGYSQNGSVRNQSSTGFDATLCVALVGGGTTTHALRTPSSGSTRLNVSGIGFGGFSDSAVRLSGGNGNSVTGNQFGGPLGSVNLNSSTVNLRIGGSAQGALVGGDDDVQRNLISYATGTGIEIVTGSGFDNGFHIVENNLIGTTRSGNGDAGNLVGMSIESGENRVRDNVISGNSLNGLTLDGSLAKENVISSNRIGLRAGFELCLPSCSGLPNGLHGITVINGASDNNIVLNSIAYNLGDGVVIGAGRHILLLSNSTHSNGGLSIDLGNDGADSNDNDAAAGASSLPNRGLNWPVLTRASGSSHSGIVSGRLTTTAGNYLIQFFADSACGNGARGEGRTAVGSTSVTIVAPAGFQGTSTFNDGSVASSSLNLVGKVISAVAVDSAGNTSELSTCRIFDDIIFADSFD